MTKRKIPAVLATVNSKGPIIAQTIIAPGSPFGRSTAGELFNIDVTNVSSVTVEFLGVYTGEAVFFHGSLTGDNWQSLDSMNRSRDSVFNYPTVRSITGTIQEIDVASFTRLRCYVNVIATGRISANVTLSSERPYISRGTFGATAHDATLLANPVVTGARAKSSHAEVNADNDASYMTATLDGKIVTAPGGAIPELYWNYAAPATGLTATGTNALKAAVASQRNYVSALQIKSGTLNSDIVLTVSDGATAIFRTGLKTGESNNLFIPFPVPLRGSVNTAINVSIDVSTAIPIYINAQGFSGH